MMGWEEWMGWRWGHEAGVRGECPALRHSEEVGRSVVSFALTSLQPQLDETKNQQVEVETAASSID